jgi:hypothetical protein
MKTILAVAALAVSTTALAQTVEVATGNWNDIPQVKKQPPIRMADRTMARIDGLLKQGKCQRFGNGKVIKMDVPFLLQFGAGGVERIVVRRIDCPELESLIGGTLASHAKEGLFKPTGENGTGWYRSNFSYYAN